MLRLKHALPLSLLISASAFAMEGQTDLVWKKDEQGKLVKVTEATVTKPAMAVTWTKQDGKFVATEGTEVSKPLTQAERPVDLLSTIAISAEYTQQQLILNQLQQEKEAAIKAEAGQLDKLKAMATELSRKLTAKQTAEAGSALAIENYKKQITELQKLQDAELANKEQIAKDAQSLKEKLNQTTKDVATAEAAKKAAEAANKKSWSLFGWGKSTSAPVAPAATPAPTVTTEVQQIAATK